MEIHVWIDTHINDATIQKYPDIHEDELTSPDVFCTHMAVEKKRMKMIGSEKAVRNGNKNVDQSKKKKLQAMQLEERW